MYVGGSYTNTSVRLGGQVFPNASVMYPTLVPAPANPYTNNYFADAFVARLDTASGSWQWAVRNGNAYEDGVTHLAADAQGRVYAAGTFDTSLIGPITPKVAQLDGATGTWGAFQDLGNVNVQALALDAQSQLHLAGSFYAATAAFGPFTLAQDGPGRSTGYVVRRGGRAAGRGPSDGRTGPVAGVAQPDAWTAGTGAGRGRRAGAGCAGPDRGAGADAARWAPCPPICQLGSTWCAAPGRCNGW